MQKQLLWSDIKGKWKPKKKQSNKIIGSKIFLNLNNRKLFRDCLRSDRKHKWWTTILVYSMIYIYTLTVGIFAGYKASWQFVHTLHLQPIRNPFKYMTNFVSDSTLVNAEACCEWMHTIRRIHVLFICICFSHCM